MPIAKIRFSPRAGGLLALALVAAAGSTALAQDDPSSDPIAGVDTDLPFFILGPRNLPGKPPTPALPKDAEKTAAAPKADERDWFSGKPWWDWSRATGDWGGLRTGLEDFGLSFAGSYTMDWSAPWSGGVNRRGNYHHLWDFSATLDTNKAFKLEGGTFFIDFQSTAGTSSAENVGDFQFTSNIETVGVGGHIDQISEVWYQQELFNKAVRIKVGKIDALSDFATVDGVADILHGATAPALLFPVAPTFPNPAFGAEIFFNPTEHTYLGFGFFDGSGLDNVSTGGRGPADLFRGSEFLYLVETGCTWDNLADLGKGRIRLGGYYHSARVTDFDGNPQRGQGGFFGIFEQQLTKRALPDDAPKDATPDTTHGLFAYVQDGIGDEDTNPVAASCAAGFCIRGTFPGRDSDVAGVHYSWIDLSNRPGAGFATDEHALELYYKIAITPFIAVTPDIQFIFNPSGSRTINDAVVGGLRVQITF